jgi:hypothetical protein
MLTNEKIIQRSLSWELVGEFPADSVLHIFAPGCRRRRNDLQDLSVRKKTRPRRGLLPPPRAIGLVWGLLVSSGSVSPGRSRAAG